MRLNRGDPAERRSDDVVSGVVVSRRTAEVATSAPLGDAQPVRVLIIDDHALFRSAVRELLEYRGFAVVAEADGAVSGLEAAERLAPEAVVLDIGLADGDGVDVCHALTQRNPELAVLLISADEPHHRRSDIRECGARGFLLKSRLPSADLAGLLRRAGEQ
jgi:DNA-binding NarL/FixJ family response regulator